VYRGVIELDGLKQSSIATINQFDVNEEEQDNLLVSVKLPKVGIH